MNKFIVFCALTCWSLLGAKSSAEAAETSLYLERFGPALCLSSAKPYLSEPARIAPHPAPAAIEQKRIDGAIALIALAEFGGSEAVERAAWTRAIELADDFPAGEFRTYAKACMMARRYLASKFAQPSERDELLAFLKKSPITNRALALVVQDAAVSQRAGQEAFVALAGERVDRNLGWIDDQLDLLYAVTAYRIHRDPAWRADPLQPANELLPIRERLRTTVPQALAELNARIFVHSALASLPDPETADPGPWAKRMGVLWLEMREQGAVDSRDPAIASLLRALLGAAQNEWLLALANKPGTPDSYKRFERDVAQMGPQPSRTVLTPDLATHSRMLWFLRSDRRINALNTHFVIAVASFKNFDPARVGQGVRDLITHKALFDFPTALEGNRPTPHDWRWNAEKRQAVGGILDRVAAVERVRPTDRARLAGAVLPLLQFGTPSITPYIDAKAQLDSGAIPAANAKLYRGPINQMLQYATALRQFALAMPTRTTSRPDAEKLSAAIIATTQLFGPAREVTYDRIERQAPGLKAFLAVPPVSLERMRQQLRDDEAVVVFYPSGKHSYAISYARDQTCFEFNDISEDQVDAAVARIRASMDSYRENVSAAFPLSDAQLLYRASFGQVSACTAGKRSLIYAAFGNASRLPPALLHDGNGFLAESRALSVAISMEQLEQLRAARTRQPGVAMLGVGAALLEHDELERGRPNLASFQSAPTAKLYGMPQFLRSVAEGFPAQSDLLLGRRQATTKAFLAKAANRRLMVFGTHGVTSEDGVEIDPYLVLAPDGAHNGQLSASIVRQLDLGATRTVVLAACDTAGASGAIGADAFSGLVTAFNSAGVHNVVASHWKVLETTTTDLLAPALRKAEAGTGLAEALREQQVRSIRSSDPAVRHPAYWAPYVVIGDGKVSLE